MLCVMHAAQDVNKRPPASGKAFVSIAVAAATARFHGHVRKKCADR